MRRPLVPFLTVLLALAGLACAGAAPPPAAAASRPPVVMLVLDEFPVGDLMRPDGTLDRRRFPGFAALAGGSTWFRNASTVHDSTPEAVPAILDGRRPRPGPGTSYRTHPRSIFTYMHALGYRVHAREEATTVCPPRICPRTDHYGNPEENILFHRRERLNRTIASLRASRRPTFTFHHSVLPHVPWVYLPSGRSRTGYRPGALPDFATPDGFGDPFLTQFNQQRHLLQVGFVDREVGRLVARLKRTGQWRRALVVVTADHGISFAVGSTDRRNVTPANVSEIAPVPLFVKRPGQTHGRMSSAYAETIDVVPTVAHLLGRPLNWSADGRSAFSRDVARRPGIDIEKRDLSGTIQVPAQEMERRRHADTVARTRLFGTGPWSRVFRIGPNRRLLGRRVAERNGLAGLPARFAVPTDLRRIRTTAPAVPTLAAGRIAGGPGTGERDLALAVNGRVAAVGRSFRLQGKAPEWFALNVPEARLRRGRNSMRLYEVSAGGSLELLGGVG